MGRSAAAARMVGLPGAGAARGAARPARRGRHDRRPVPGRALERRGAAVGVGRDPPAGARAIDRHARPRGSRLAAGGQRALAGSRPGPRPHAGRPGRRTPGLGRRAARPRRLPGGRARPARPSPPAAPPRGQRGGGRRPERRLAAGLDRRGECRRPAGDRRRGRPGGRHPCPSGAGPRQLRGGAGAGPLLHHRGLRAGPAGRARPLRPRARPGLHGAQPGPGP